MACKIADNKPLARLARELEIKPRCHGKRRECIQGFQTHGDEFVMGAAGAAIGYCQALFANAGDPALHTKKVRRLLREIEAPWVDSHELQWSYRLSSTAREFVSNACAPLLGIGRVPILISSLDPARQTEELLSIFATSPSIPQEETILVRVVLNDSNSVAVAGEIIKGLLAEARATRRMPRWWPLLQGAIDRSQWASLKSILKKDWDYINAAVNPFVGDDVFEEIQSQITVAQIPVANANGVLLDGHVVLDRSVRILGASEDESYSLPAFTQKLAKLPTAPTLIVLGPSQPDWSDEFNRDRVASLLPLLRNTCDRLWFQLSPERRTEVWRLAA